MTTKHPQAGVEVCLPSRPKCDFCPMPAYYDFKTKMGPWAYGCEEHYRRNTAHRSLGTGMGQRILVAFPPKGA